MTADDIVLHYLETGVLDEDALARLPDPERQRVRDQLPDLDQLRADLRDGELWVDPAPGLEDAVLASILAAPARTVTDLPPRAAGPDAAAVSAGPAPEVGAGSVVALADARARRSRLVAIGASAVAAAAAVVAVVGFSTRTPSPAADTAAVVSITRPDPAPTTTPVDAGDRTFALTATDLQPGAGGQVRLRETPSGVRVRLDATGLPRRTDGEFYEAWAKTTRGLVSIGTFHSGEEVVLWSGVDLDQFTAISVTLEEDDGDLSSSGRRVLLAAISPTAPPSGTAPAPTGSTSSTSSAASGR